MTFSHWRPQRNWGPRLREFEWLGMRALSLENELLRVSVLIDKGSDVFEFLYKPLDLDFVWFTANGFRHPRVVPPGDRASPFIDSYGGGWQEVLPNGGAPSDHAGASYGQHGEIALLPWDYEVVEDTEQAVIVRMSVTCLQTPLRLVKELRLEAGSARLEVSELIANASTTDVSFMWGQHLVFGAPFLSPGARITLPNNVEGIPHAHALTAAPRRVGPKRFHWPHASSPDGDPINLAVLPDESGSSDIVYLTGFPEDAWYEVTCRGAGLRVGWDARVMPYLWFWQEFHGTSGYPWYGRHWNIGLEPFSSYPTNGLADAVANRTALTLAGRAQRSFSFFAEVIAS
jgi:hypothetical protein